MLGDLFYQLGRVVGTAQAFGGQVADDGEPPHANVAPNHAGASADPGDPDAALYDEEPPATGPGLDGTVAGIAGAWLLTLVLRPRPVSWPRVVVAGLAATVLAELVARTLERDVGQVLDGPGGPEADADAEAMAEAMAGRFGAGVAVAAGYASLLYPRIPGPPLVRGLIFSALDLAAAPRGGLVRLAADTPGLKYPLKSFARPVETGTGSLSHLAFGLGLGLFYRYEPAIDREDEYEDDEDDNGDAE